MGEGPAVKVKELDHIVLMCADVEKTIAWYVDELGMTAERLEEWRRKEAFFPSARINDGTIIDFFQGTPEQAAEGGRLDHLCIVVEPTDLAALAESGRFDVISGPVERWGARGNGQSLYVHDPDGTTVEIRYYP